MGFMVIKGKIANSSDYYPISKGWNAGGAIFVCVEFVDESGASTIIKNLNVEQSFISLIRAGTEGIFVFDGRLMVAAKSSSKEYLGIEYGKGIWKIRTPLIAIISAIIFALCLAGGGSSSAILISGLSSFLFFVVWIIRPGPVRKAKFRNFLKHNGFTLNFTKVVG